MGGLPSGLGSIFENNTGEENIVSEVDDDCDARSTNTFNDGEPPQCLDLTFVAPERRGEVLRRIRVIERFIGAPGRGNAEAAAAELGLRVAQFYNLVRAWRDNRRPDGVAGAGSPRNRRFGMDPAQLLIIDTVVARSGQSATVDIIEAVVAEAKAAGIALPGRGTISRHVRRTRPGVLTEDIKAELDLLVDHTVLDLSVDYGSVTLTRPLATMVIDVAADAIVGIALSSSKPSSHATAAALLDALRRGIRNGDRNAYHKPRLGLVAANDGEAGAVLNILTHVGFDARTRITGAHGGGQAIEALRGSCQAGIRLKPRLVWNDGPRRQAEGGKKALQPNDALALVRGRFMDARSTSVFGRLADSMRLRLINDLAKESQAPGRG